MRLAIVESPFAGKGETKRLRDIQTLRNTVYARACMHDSLERGEAPLASHLLYTQAGILDDTKIEERIKGMEAGYEWMRAMANDGRFAEDALKPVVAFYTDLGWSEGMNEALGRVQKLGLEMEERKLGADWHDSVDAADYHYSYLLEQSITGLCTCGHDAKDHLLAAGTTAHDITTKRLVMCGVPGCCTQYFREAAKPAVDDANLQDAYTLLREALERRAAKGG